jgi:hypothetical protein
METSEALDRIMELIERAPADGTLRPAIGDVLEEFRFEVHSEGASCGRDDAAL